MCPGAEACWPAGDRRRVVLAVLSVVTLMAGGCLVGPNYVRPKVEQPAQFKSQADKEPAPPIAREWWHLYGDPELDQLIVTANASNQSLRLAVARVGSGRAHPRRARSYLFPTLSSHPTLSPLATPPRPDSPMP